MIPFSIFNLGSIGFSNAVFVYDRLYILRWKLAKIIYLIHENYNYSPTLL